MRIYVFLLGMFIALSLQAQRVQKGMVTILNSKNTPLTGVSILTVGSQPATADEAGNFALNFKGGKVGKAIVVVDIQKKGYEVVNEVQISSWVMTNDKLKIVMCKQGLLAESKRQYYGLGEDYYKKRYLKKKKEIEESEAVVAEKKEEIQKLELEYQEAMNRLDYYSDLFSRINEDELSELDARALALVKQGKIDEAIRLYEESHLVDKFRNWVEGKDSLDQIIESLEPLMEIQKQLRKQSPK